jgi:SWI/SNF related-matrix-associated actin-dependent regulator of chromatin subfamily C
MSQLDFILMDSAEVPGSVGASWTDQETLLLLEALEIFKGNEWDGIAEHVATKNKVQCMLYFLQMPILDSFLDDDDFFNQTSQNVTGKDSSENVTEVLEKMENSKKANANSEEQGINLADNNVSAEKDTENSVVNDLVAASVVDGLYKTSVTSPANKKKSSGDNVSGEHASSFVIDVLRSAFEAVGHFPEKEDTGSFTEAGNPAMALVSRCS